MNAYLDAMRRYFTFSGRSTRSQYWLFILTFAAMLIIAVIIDAATGSAAREGIALVTALVNLVHIIPNFAVTIRRLHDTGRTGWWLLLGFVPIIGQVVLLVWLASPAQAEANRFGPYPGQPAGTLPQRPSIEPQMQAYGANLDRLEKLAALRASGAIDDEEFQRLKAATLKRGEV